MIDNLKVTRYNDGTPIPQITDNTEWLNLTSPGMAWFDNGEYGVDDYGNEEYGALYNFYVVSDTNSLNVCPVGWHVPTDAEITDLIFFLDNNANTDPSSFGVQSTVAGGLMKEAGLSHWNSPNTAATNSSGFTALPAGTRVTNGAYGDIGVHCGLYSSTEGSVNNGIYRYLNFSSSDILRVSLDKRLGLSVRCIKD